MVEGHAELINTLSEVLAQDFRGRLLDRGLARSLIWNDGILPDGAPAFTSSLSGDLLDYAYTIMSMALRLRSEDPDSETAKRAFFIAGESIRAVVHRGALELLDRGFHQVSAAVAFHLAGYSAMAYSIVPTNATESNLAPTEEVLVLLFRRQLQEMRSLFSRWLRDDQNLDHRVAVRLREEDGFEQDDAVHTLITTSFMRGLALFDHAITVGDAESADAARDTLRNAAEVAGDLNFVNHWWTCTLASHLIDDLWGLCLHERIPRLPPSDPDYATWIDLRDSYVKSLMSADRASIELWPSQLEAVRRAADPHDNLVVSLPTSAGKTRIAELCILRTLASDRRIIYVTPLRALSAQVERDLAQTFLPLGYSVSSLYTSVDIETGDGQTLRDGHIVVSTPEKLSFALRNDPTIVDEIGLVVLDEGHMLGVGEREVRYEMLVESLLSRDDAASRRIVSLSALFPTPDKMSELVAWIRQDMTGEPIYSDWRPTRRRFGTVQWLTDNARLEIAVEEQRPFVPRFIEQQLPPEGSRRRSPFPNNKNELTLATAWRFIRRGQRVLIYTPLRRSVETLGRLVLKSVEQGVLTPLKGMDNRVQDAVNTGTEWLGEDHPAVQCLQYGVVLHHGGLPRVFLSEVERILRSGDCPLVIASPTLAQGLNLSASVLLVPSIFRNRNTIPSDEFANVAGRAGRAFVDMEGLVIHIIREKTAAKSRRALRRWDSLIKSSGSIQIVSGLLELTVRLSVRIADQAGVPYDEVLNYISANSHAWEFKPLADSEDETVEIEWEVNIASLDTAILTLMEPEIDEAGIDDELAQALSGSLFERKISDHSQDVQILLHQFVAARARHVWSSTNERQRRGFHLAGLGFRAGTFLDSNIVDLATLLLEAEAAIETPNVPRLAQAVIAFAEIVCQVAPFRPRRSMPDGWQHGLTAWLEGRSASEVISLFGGNGVDFLQDTVAYRLPWAMEAVRVHAMAVGTLGSDELKGLAAMVTETGSANLSVNTLIRCGLRSRAAAGRVVETTGASFVDRTGMESWLASDEVQSRINFPDWPTAQTRHDWTQFYERELGRRNRTWIRESAQCNVRWYDSTFPSGTAVVLEPIPGEAGALVMSPDFREIGIIEESLGKPFSHIVGSHVADDSNVLMIDFFGPD